MMSEINVGDRVKIKDRPDWPTPPGYRLAESEGIVIKIWEQDGPDGSEPLQNYVSVRIIKTGSAMDITFPYNFRMEALERM